MTHGQHRYSKRNYSGVLLLGGFAPLPFAFIHWNAGEHLFATLIVALTLAIWGLAACGLTNSRMATGPLMAATAVCNICCVLIMVQMRDIGIYWFYPLLMVIAFIMPWRWSIPVNALTVAIAIVSAAGWMPETHFIRLFATLLASLVFAALFSYNLNKHQEMLNDLAVHDPLTGAFNRRYFERKIDEARRHWQRTGRFSSMILLDIDHFKQVNDRYGHSVGDAVLVKLSQYISAQLRPMDRFFRLGGEEFAILLPDTPAEQGATKLAERIRQHLAAGSLEEGLPAFTVSCGVADYPETGSTSNWPDQCDAALYAAKAAGRNTVVLAERMSEQTRPT